MSGFNRDALRKGTQAIDDAVESAKKGGDFRPFLSNIYWGEDKDERYLLFLNPIEEIPQVELHPFIDLEDGIPHMIMARTDPSIGEAVDPIRKAWLYKPRLTNMAIAVELEPEMSEVKNRLKPVGFTVATRTFERAVRDDDGNDLGEVEEMTVPVVGLVAQSPHNFFNQLRSFDATEAPINTTPLKITRLGQKDVTYQVVGYEGINLDLSMLFDQVMDLSYVTEKEELVKRLEGLDNEEAKCAEIGDYLLYRRLGELADEDEYNSVYTKITKPAKYPEQAKKGRSTKPSQRRHASASEEEVSKTSPIAARMAKLHDKAAKKSE